MNFQITDLDISRIRAANFLEADALKKPEDLGFDLSKPGSSQLEAKRRKCDEDFRKFLNEHSSEQDQLREQAREMNISEQMVEPLVRECMFNTFRKAGLTDLKLYTPRV